MRTKGADDHTVRARVRERYAEIARQGGSCCGGAESCCGGATGAAAAAGRLGYTEAEIAAAPPESNLGLGCGNPQAIAGLKPGEVVLDLGSGAGFDCFVAARQVGPSGRVIGVDMTPEMLARARENAAKAGCDNVEFRLGEIEHLPVADSLVDVILSNCVVNLCPDKRQVYREAFRVLRPGGRLAISDVVAVKRLPAKVRASLDAQCGCIAGAALVSELEQMLADIGFTDVRVRVKEESREVIRGWFPGSGVERYVRSAEIEARRGPPVAACAASRLPAGDRELDDRTEELIAIGASVAGHCQPCLAFHIARARELGVPEAAVRSAVAVGHRVEKGAMAAMRQFAGKQAGAAGLPPRNGCGAGSAPKGSRSCCG